MNTLPSLSDMKTLLKQGGDALEEGIETWLSQDRQDLIEAFVATLSPKQKDHFSYLTGSIACVLPIRYHHTSCLAWFILIPVAIDPNPMPLKIFEAKLQEILGPRVIHLFLDTQAWSWQDLEHQGPVGWRQHLCKLLNTSATHPPSSLPKGQWALWPCAVLTPLDMHLHEVLRPKRTASAFKRMIEILSTATERLILPPDFPTELLPWAHARDVEYHLQQIFHTHPHATHLHMAKENQYHTGILTDARGVPAARVSFQEAIKILGSDLDAVLEESHLTIVQHERLETLPKLGYYH